MEDMSAELIREKCVQALWEFNKKEFIKTGLEMAKTAIEIADRDYTKEDVAGGNAARLHAEKLYAVTLKSLGELSAVTSSDNAQLVKLSRQVEKAIARLKPVKSLESGRGRRPVESQLQH